MASSFWKRARTLYRSFAIKIIFIAIVFLIVPIIFYRLFQTADAQQTQLLRRTVEEKAELIVSAIEPHLRNFQDEPPEAFQASLDRLAGGGVNIRILMRAINNAGPTGFSYIASGPAVSADYLKEEREKLIELGVFDKLAATCDGETTPSDRFTNPAGKPELLTSVTPVHVGDMCWLIITSQTEPAILSTSIGQPVWKTPTIQIAALIYVLSTIIVGWVFVDIWRNIDRFRSAARKIRVHDSGDISFRELNTVPELGGVADDFDSLVDALKQSKEMIIQLAEEHAHALKAPLAVISQAIEPLKRALPETDLQAQRSFDLIERSAARLDVLVSAGRDLDRAAAEVIYETSRRMDISQCLAKLVAAYEPALAAEGKSLHSAIERGVFAYATEECMEAIVENLLENAASFTGTGGKVEVILGMSGDAAHLTIADNGPGVPTEHLPKIFDRNFTARERDSAETKTGADHFGLGLWIVRRNVTGLGGQVAAQNRENGGFSVTVKFRAA